MSTHPPAGRLPHAAAGDALAPPFPRPLSLRRLLRHGSARDRALVLGAWALSTLASIGLGLLTVTQFWSGLPLHLGGPVTVYVTVYPPLLICLGWALCFGWWWGAVPAYLATLTLALYAGMPPAWALLFAFSNPLGFALMTLGYRAMPMDRTLRGLTAWLFYVQLSFVASVFSSAGALVWCYTNRIDTTGLLPIWQGWWLGGFLQKVLLLGPVLAAAGPALARWQAARAPLLSPAPANPRPLLLLLMLAVMAGVLGYAFTTLHLGGQRLEAALQGGADGAVPEAARTLLATAWVFFWVFALLVVFGGLFGYRLFRRWQAQSDRWLGELALLARTDELTGLHNRRETADRLRAQWLRVRRYGEPAAVVIIDIDHFKAINDRHGHAAGDAVLRSLATTLRDCTRAIDVAGRWGGEEFVVILPQTPRDGALEFAERLRQCVVASTVTLGGATIGYRISLGVAMASPDDASPEAWLKRADRALYASKAGGRDRSVIADEAAGPQGAAV